MSYQNNVQEIVNVEDHDAFIQNNDKCIMFFGSNRCKKCDNMTTSLNDIAKNYPQIKFSHVEVTRTTVENLGDSLPVFVCYKNNLPVGKVVGTDKNGIINMIQNNFVERKSPIQPGTLTLPKSINNNFINTPVRMLNSQNGRRNNNESRITEINDLINYNKFISTNNKCFIFFGSERCPHCQNIKSKINQLVNEYPNIKFCHIEVTNKTHNIIPSQYQESGIPLFICYKNNLLVGSVIGEDEEAVVKMIKNLVED